MRSGKLMHVYYLYCLGSSVEMRRNERNSEVVKLEYWDTPKPEIVGLGLPMGLPRPIWVDL